ncbi:MAG: copper resistance CopC family protein [Alphaproteobacteria bacterium]
MKLRLIAAASALFLLLPTAAHANSLVEASPASGAVLGIAPNAVSITGASTLQADGNQLSVIDPKGNPVDDGSITVTDASVVVGLKPLTAAGVYTVSYTLLAAGEAPLQGSYTFLFNAPADMAAASASPTPTPTISKTGGATSSSHGAAIFVVVIFLLGCAVLLFLLWYARTLWRQTQRKKRKATKKKSAPSTRA